MPHNLYKHLIAFSFLSLILGSITFAQTPYATVIAPSGLSMRAQPGLSAERIGKLEFGQDVAILETTSHKLELKDGDQIIKGKWVKVQAIESPPAYVFDGYLLPRTAEPEKNILGCEDHLPCDTKVSFDAFTAVIHDYQTEKILRSSAQKDSLFLMEFVFNELDEKILQIIPEQEGDRMEVFFTRNETITEQPLDGMDENFDWEQWVEIRERWSGPAAYEKLTGKNNFFRLPAMDFQAYEKQLKQRMGLRDTLVIIPGEYEENATVVYKEKVCYYLIDRVYIKVVVHRAGKRLVRYLGVTLSYGC